MTDVARRLDRGGADELWIIEDCFFTAGPSLVSAALTSTERLTVGLGILPAVARTARDDRDGVRHPGRARAGAVPARYRSRRAVVDGPDGRPAEGSLSFASSCVRTSTGTSARTARMERRMPIAVFGSEKLMTTAFAFSRPARSRSSSSAESPKMIGVARLARGAHARRIEVDGDVLEAMRLQHARHVLPDAAEAAQDHVLALGDAVGDGILALDGGAGRPALAQQEARDALVVAMTNGLTIIDSAIATSSGCPMFASAATAPSPCSTSVSSAMPNSPAIEMTTPVRMALNHESTNQRVTSAATVAFSTMSPSSMRGHERELVAPAAARRAACRP